jgi:hypothetical protein
MPSLPELGVGQTVHIPAGTAGRVDRWGDEPITTTGDMRGPITAIYSDPEGDGRSMVEICTTTALPGNPALSAIEYYYFDQHYVLASEPV